MGERIWDKFLTERDKAVFAASGYGVRAGYGKRPVLLVIDVNHNFAGDRPEPILDSIGRWPNSCGQDAWDAVPAIRALIDAAHAKGLPVIYTTGDVRADGWDRGSWSWKNSRTGTPPKPPNNLDRNAILEHRHSQTQAERVLRDESGIVSDALGRRFSHRDGNHHERLRARDGSRCVQQ